MKKTIFIIATLLIPLMFISSCTKADDKKTEEKEKNAKPIKEVENISMRAVFAMLPADAIPEYINHNEFLEQLEKVADSYDFDNQIPGPIQEFSEANGFISMSEAQFGWEAAARRLDDGRIMLVINNATEFGSELKTFFYENGTLAEKIGQHPADGMYYEFDKFIDTSEVDEEIAGMARDLFERRLFYTYFFLPREGDEVHASISFHYLDEYDALIQYDMEMIKDVVLQWHDTQWIEK